MSNENVSAPFGLRPVRTLSGSPYNGRVTRYRKEASVILGIGDPVVLTGTSSIAGTNGALQDGVPIVTRAAAGSGTITGAIVGFEFDLGLPGPAHNAKYMAAADKGYVLVADDPHLIFEIQEDSVGGAMAVTVVGEFADLATVGNAASTGYSTVMLDSSDAATGDNLRIFALADIVNNILGDYAVWEVMINEHTYNGVTTPV